MRNVVPRSDRRLELLRLVMASEEWLTRCEEVANYPEPHVWMICDLHDELGRAFVTWSGEVAQDTDDVYFFPLPRRVYLQFSG